MFGARRNKSFIQADDDDDGDMPKRSNKSFHAPTDLQRQRDSKDEDDHDQHEDTIGDLHETIANLKESVMSHANSSAETMEHFTTLQKAHDTLYKEHVHLQEQMDDAVELLKYLKLEKGNYEGKIEKLTDEMEALRGADQDNVVSMTIGNLTREKMELESSLADARGRGEDALKKLSTLDCEKSELLVQIDSLTKVKEAYELQTRQQLETKTKMNNMEKERGELMGRVMTLEIKETNYNDQQMKMRGDYEARIEQMNRIMEEDKGLFAKLQGEKDNLLNEQKSMQEQLDGLRGDLDKYQAQEGEIEVLNTKLVDSLSHIAQLQRERRESSGKESNSLMEINSKFAALESVNNNLLQEKKDMQLYVTKMEETLMQKDQLLEAAAGEAKDGKKMLQQRLASLRDEIEGEFGKEREGVAQQLSSLQEALNEKEETSRQLQQQVDKSKQAVENNHNELMLENSTLQYKLQDLQEQLDEQTNATMQRGEVHAQLEKEMQERLAKRIAAQLHEQKIAMETQIRGELEAEFHGKQQEVSTAAKELEDQLRQQLFQVKDEREKWKSEQEEIQKKVLDSQQQFEQVREGFKSKINKEKARARDLEDSNQGQKNIIEKLSEEYKGVVEKLEKLQAKILSDKQLTEQQWKADKASLLERHQMQLKETGQCEEQYANQVHELQNEINELINEQTAHENEYNQWEDEKESLNDELRRAMEDLEQLNSENAEYLEKVKSYENTASLVQEQADEYEDSRVKFSVLQIEQKELKQELAKRDEHNEGLMKQMEQLNSENEEFQQQITNLEQRVNDLSTNLSSTQEERDDLQDSLQETNELCLEMESKLSSYKHEKGKALDEYQSKIRDLEGNLSQAEAAAASTRAAISEKEKAISDMSQMESRHQEVVAGLQAQVSNSTSQISKLIDSLSSVSHEKATLAAKFESVSSDSSTMKDTDEAQKNKIMQLESSIESLSAERDAANAQVIELLSGSKSVDQVISSLQSERNELVFAADENKKSIARIAVGEAEAIAKAGDLEHTISELQAKAESSKCEIDNLKAQIEAAHQRQTIAESKDNAAKNNSTNVDNETIIQALQLEINKLKETNTQLTVENTALKTEGVSDIPQSAGPSVDDLMKDLVDVNNNFQRLQHDHQDELNKLKDQLRDAKDNNVVLEEACNDIQVEKEDLELENEELASKLTDLTTQAKKMLLSNETLEETVQDQQIEYEDRIAELESQVEDGDFLTLRQKHKAALETIVKLKKEIDMSGQGKSEDCDSDSHSDQLKRIEDENSELRQLVDHLSSETDAAKEIKLIVLELRAKNKEMSESLRVSQEQNEAAADVLENLKADNDHLREDIMALRRDTPTVKMLTAEAHDDRAAPLEHGTDDSTNRSKLEAELKYYKSVVSQMSKDRNVLNQRLSELMDISGPTQDMLCAAASPQASINEGALIPHESNNLGDHLNSGVFNQGAMVIKTDTAEHGSYDPPSTQLHHPTEEVEEQIRNLTIENGQLAQRLGGAVAEKEFAMSTLSKLGAKMEELMERNQLLSDLADVKSSRHSTSGANYYSGGEDVWNNHQLSLTNKGRGRDPEASVEVANNSTHSYYGENETPAACPAPYGHDDASVYSDMDSTLGSTILSFEPPKKLEPESASHLGGIAEDDVLELNNYGDREGGDQVVNDLNEASAEKVSSSSEPRLVKVPGGEYFGQLNERGQKHGDGKMKYDNGNEYEGQWNNNKRDGKGITKYASGNVYTGTWKTGKRHGFGVFHIKKTGDIYRGNWAQGLKSGPGVYEYADGELDVSFYQEDIRLGDGVRWSASRRQASRLVDGQLVGEEGDMPLDEASKLTKHLGFAV
ncbi:hypothetical protein ACHAXR_009782 [Thalassiosira sp. AJA248-18]